MKNYITLANCCEDEFTEKRSRFIGCVSPTATHEEAMKFLEERKSQNYDARHNVWAYILKDGTMRYSDDGEPQGTGGQPVLEVLKRSGITDVVCVVTRYFGGILLGAGGLTRAYANGAVIALAKAQKVEISRSVKFFCDVNYNHYQSLERIIRENNTVIENTEFTDKVKIFCVIRFEDYENLEKIITETFSATIKPQITSECLTKMPPKLQQ